MIEVESGGFSHCFVYESRIHGRNRKDRALLTLGLALLVLKAGSLFIICKVHTFVVLGKLLK